MQIKNSELELFYEMFHTYDPPSDPSKEFIFKPDYNRWLKYLKNNNLYVVELNHQKIIHPLTDYVIDHKKSKFLCSRDYNFFKAYLDNESQSKINHILLTALDIVKNDIFSPPVINILQDIHPGKDLTSAHVLLRRDIPALLYVKKDEDISSLSWFKIKKQIYNLFDLQKVYGGIIHGNFALTEPYPTDRLQIWSEGHWANGSDERGWIKFPEIKWYDFFTLLSDELNKLEGDVISFVHKKAKRKFKLTIPNNPKEDISIILKRIAWKM